MPKLKIRKRYYYILNTKDLLNPHAINHIFFNKKAAKNYIRRRFNNDTKHYLILKGEKLTEFNLYFKRLKHRFYSKWPIPDSRILSDQDRKTFRTTIRRKLYGYMRVMPYSHRCDRCTESYPDNPLFAKLRDYLFNGRKRRLCEKCHQRYLRENNLLDS